MKNEDQNFQDFIFGGMRTLWLIKTKSSIFIMQKKDQTMSIRRTKRTGRTYNYNQKKQTQKLI